MNNKREIGTKFEQISMSYLQEQGYRIIEHNYYSRLGEADIIAIQNNELCFVEVKYRKDSTYGTAAEAITPTKIKRLIKTAKVFIMKNSKYQNYNIRFDVVAIDGNKTELIKNAFEAY